LRVEASEIEAALQDHPAVLEACVVGVPDPAVGERIKAFVVLKEDVRGVSSTDLLKFLRERLAPYKIPHYIEFRGLPAQVEGGEAAEARDEGRGAQEDREDLDSLAREVNSSKLQHIFNPASFLSST